MTDPAIPRRALKIEVGVVLAVTFGMSAVTAILVLIDSALRTLSKQTVALNPKRSYFDLIDLGLNLASIAQLVAWGALGLYLLARVAGLSASVVPSALDDTWWRVPVLIAAAVANSWAEEVIVVAYLITRLRQLGVSDGWAICWSSLLRGAYHLYQGFSAGLGNVVMGLVFGYVWRRTGRLWPLIVAHALIDFVAFVGYALAANHLSWLP